MCIRDRISADDDLAVEKLTKKLEGLESQQATMKAVNAYFRKHKTLDSCPELTPEQAEKLKADMAQSWHLDLSLIHILSIATVRLPTLGSRSLRAAICLRQLCRIFHQSADRKKRHAL